MKKIDGVKERIVLELNNEEDLCPSELEGRLPRSRRTIKRHLEDLNDMGLVVNHMVEMPHGGTKKAYRLIEDSVNVEFKWKDYLPDAFALLTSTVYVLIMTRFFSIDVFYGYLMPFTLFFIVVCYKSYNAGDNRIVEIE